MLFFSILPNSVANQVGKHNSLMGTHNQGGAGSVIIFSQNLYYLEFHYQYFRISETPSCSKALLERRLHKAVQYTLGMVLSRGYPNTDFKDNGKIQTASEYF